jgi:hypothetical protein
MVQTLSPPRPTLEDPEPEPVIVGPVRRLVRPRDALVTIVVCLSVWALLFAPVLRRSAEAGPVGARRSAALAVLRPLAALSDALAFDTASETVLRAIGRDPEAPPGGELELPELEDLPPLPPPETDPAPPRGSPSTEPSPSASPQEEPRDDRGDGGDRPDRPDVTIRTPTADTKLRVAVIGDSLSQGLGPAIETWFDPDVSRVLALGRQSTGLARVDYFNWQLALRRIEEEFRPDVLFVMLGSNDGQAQISPDGEEVPVGSVAWTEAYRARAETFLAEATGHGTHVVWVGIPIVRDHARWDFYRRVNDIYRQTAAADPFATYLDAWDLFRTRSGGYAAYLRNERGVLQEMRAADGLHLTPSGYAYLARAAIRAAADAFDLPQRAVTFPV